MEHEPTWITAAPVAQVPPATGGAPDRSGDGNWRGTNPLTATDGRAKLKEIMASPDPMAAALEAGASMHVSRRGIDMRLPAPPAPPQQIEATIEFATKCKEALNVEMVETVPMPDEQARRQVPEMRDVHVVRPPASPSTNPSAKPSPSSADPPLPS